MPKSTYGPIRTILVATDLSTRSDRAVARAFALGRATGAHVRVVAVVDDHLPSEMVNSLKAAAGQRLQRATEDSGLGAAATAEVLTGDVAAVLATASDSADLVVLGLHRARALGDAFRETTMERIVRLAARPVLLVAEPADHSYMSVLAAIDFSPASAQALRVAAAIAPDANVTALHAVHIPYRGLIGNSAAAAAPFIEDATAHRTRWMASEEPPLSGEVKIVEGAPATVLANAHQSLSPDLLVLGAHSRSGLSVKLLGGLTAEIIRNPPTDVLIARPATA